MKTPLIISTLIAGLAGCASVLNTAGESEFGCPGMPKGIVCKTPAAVYKSTNQDPADSEFDTPIGMAGSTPSVEKMTKPAATMPALGALPQAKPGPKPVREEARVVRIWIAPWVDKQDNLHLASTQYAEVKPRTWTVGRPEAGQDAGGYVIPHLAYESIGAVKNERNETRPSDAPTSGQPQSSRDLSGMPEAPK